MSQLLVDDIVNKDDTGAPGFSKGVIVTGIITATSLSGNATGLTGTPNIVVNNITGVAVTFTGDLDVNAGLDVDGHTELDDLNVVGVSTFTSTINTDIVNDSRGFNVGTPALSVARMGKQTDGSGYCNIRDSSGANGISLNGSSGSGTFAGSVKIGGTAAANEIDAYEEATWTPTFHGTLNSGVWAATGTYTKIGNTVTIQMKQTGGDVSWSLGTWIVGGLPFTPGADCAAGSMTDTGPSFGGIVSLQGSTRIYASTAASNITTLRITATYIV